MIQITFMKYLFDYLSAEQLKQIKMISLQKEEILFNEGDVCQCVGLVLEGEVEIISFSYTGSEIIFNQLTPGMMFGNNLVFSSDPHYKGSVIAKKPAKIGLIYKNTLISLMKNNEGFMLEYLKIQSDTGKQLNNKIKLLSLASAEERFFYFLNSQGGRIYYQSITKLASALSLQRETLSRLITKLVKDNRIQKTKHYIKSI